MALPLFRFPADWGGSMNCGSVGFSGAKLTCNSRAVYPRPDDGWTNWGGSHDDDELVYCRNSSETHNFCECHAHCSQCCSVAADNPIVPAVWSAVIEPYTNAPVSCEWSEQVISDLTLKLNGLDPEHGVGVLHGLLLLNTDDGSLCRNFLELGVDVEKRYVKFDPSLEQVSLLDIKEELNGGTALHFAALLGQKKCLEALLDAGGDVTAKTSAGLTPLKLAKDCTIKQILKSVASSGPKSLAQIAQERKYFALRYRMRAGKVRPGDLMQTYQGKTAMDWIWATMSDWRFGKTERDDDIQSVFMLMSEMKHRYKVSRGFQLSTEENVGEAAGGKTGAG